MTTTFAQLGIPDDICAALADRGLDVEGSFTISPTDPHPSVLGHAVLAEMLLEALATSGLLADLEARATAR